MADWTSLEVAKLVVQAAVPVVLAIVGFAIKSELMRRENVEWRSRIQVEWRLRLFEEMATDLNKLYCAFNYVGGWRSMSPPDILTLKRKLDQNFHIYDFFWSQQFRQAYSILINACFEVNRGASASAVLRANLCRYKYAWLEGWQDSWDSMFVTETQRLRREEFNELYGNLMLQLRKDIGLNNNNYNYEEENGHEV
ncbi:MAG: hypothetical protein WCP97_09270 [bacterium]